MKNVNYIDKIVSDSLKDYKQPVSTEWGEMSNIIDQTANVVVKKSFLSTLTAKIAIAVSFVGAVAATFILNPFAKNTTEKTSILKPTELTVNNVALRKVIEPETEIEDIASNDNTLIDRELEKTEPTKTNEVEPTKDTASNNSTVVVVVEQTVIDTVKKE